VDGVEGLSERLHHRVRLVGGDACALDGGLQGFARLDLDRHRDGGGETRTGFGPGERLVFQRLGLLGGEIFGLDLARFVRRQQQRNPDPASGRGQNGHPAGDEGREA
jgi:hypothetical protein